MERARRDTLRKIFKWTVYALLILLSFFLQVTPAGIRFLSVRPILLLPAAVAVSMFEKETACAFIGAFAGLLWDNGANRLTGFNAILLLVLCTSVSLLISGLMKNKLLNAVLLTGAALAVQGTVDYFFHYAIWGYENLSGILWNRVVPVYLFSLLFIVPYYYLVRLIHARFAGPEEADNRE